MRPLCTHFKTDATFVFDETCLDTFTEIKKTLISTPIMIAPHWSRPFEIMCDTSDFAIGVVLG